jgi:hypothetical protein
LPVSLQAFVEEEGLEPSTSGISDQRTANCSTPQY